VSPYGGMTARLTIALGRGRGQQVRAALRNLALPERQHFFEQLAGRIFPGVVATTGAVRNEATPDEPLELLLTCRGEHFLAARALELGQVAPGLGLRQLFADRPERRFPLLVDAILFETTTFRVHLPAGVRVAQLPRDAELHSAFGDYRVSFRTEGPGDVSITRSFHVPAQLVAPEAYAEFARFAERIEAAERPQILLRRP